MTVVPSGDIDSIAIDLDGTLLRPDRTYDRARFARMLDACEARDVRVVIATGRQYLSLLDRFDEPDRLAFVSDNGSTVVDRGREPVHRVVIDPSVVERVVALLADHEEVAAVAAGPDRAWMSHRSPVEVRTRMGAAYNNLHLVDDLREVDGPVSKFALVTRDGQSARLAEEFSQSLGRELVPVTTGHQGIDLIQPGRHKAFGLGLLLERWGLGFETMVAFGDSFNDLEMLSSAGRSHAMAQAEAAAVEAARFRAPSNADSGVMQVVEELLGLDA